jgi:hypothetical protein
MALLDSETQRLRALAASGVRAVGPELDQTPFNVRFSAN